MKGKKITYSAAELAWVKANATLPKAELHSGFVARFGRNDVSVDNLKALRTRKGWRTGRTGQFAKGDTPPNKGKTCAPGKGGNHPRARATQFKAGNKPANRRPLWSERIDVYGYVEIKVPVTNPYTKAKTRFMHKHRYLWEQANGPLPKGKALKCLDGNRLNTDPENWIAVPRGMLPRLNNKHGRAYDKAPDAVKPTVMAVATLEHAITTRTRKPKPEASPVIEALKQMEAKG